MKLSEYIPNEEELAAIKHKKKIYQTGTEQFNVKPGKGIAYLQEHGLFATPLDPGEVVTFLRENPKLEKKQIGEYIGARKNEKCLEAFQKSFNYEDTRVDEALRMFLETFRLPGEAPVIQYILEHFAEHWHKMNGEPFANADAAFTLAYAVIMLNVDQHNLNAKKQNVPMTMHEFKKNLKKVNGGDDFDQDMLEETFAAIKNEEIVMPAEQTGLVKENYLWKVLLRRGSSKEGAFIHVPTGAFDRDLFSLVWGPTVAALSFVFDKSSEDGIVQKAISGFRKCAMISAHYGMSDVFDNLVISLCKFTTLLSSQEIERLPIIFGNNAKAKMAAHTVFGLAHHHGDILREGWKNILDCMLQLYKAKLLPEVFVTVEDFLDPSGKISLVREEKENQRSESGLVSGFFSYFAMTESPQQRGPTPEEQEAIKQAKRCIDECHVHQLVQESKFLRMDSLHELIKSLIVASQCPDGDDPIEGTTCTEDSAVFFLELLIEVVLQNRDRISPLWQSVRDHIYNLVVNAVESTFLVERAVVGLLRIAKRLLRRDEIAPQVLSSLHILLMMKPKVIHSLSRQIAYGLHDLLKTNAANIHSSQDWFTLFTLLEVVGAGTSPPPIMQVNNDINISETLSDAGAQSDSEITATAPADTHGERGYTSDSELYGSQNKVSADDTLTTDKPPTRHGSWLMVNREDIENTKKQQAANQYNIVLNEEFKHHDVKSLTKCCETLAFLVRDAAHVTPHNFESCVHCLRTFVEASVNGGHFLKAQNNHNQPPTKRKSKKRGSKDSDMKKSRSSPSSLRNMVPDSDDENETDNGHNVSIQLLDLMHTLHTRAATIFSSWAEEEEGSPPQPLPAAPREEATPGEQTGEKTEGIDAGTSTLWIKCWCPLLQGIARLCCDSRRNVRSQALTYLQRALLVHDLQTLSAVEWENCFNKVLFPLLHKLLDTINAQDPCGIEETRMRGSTLLCKVFLQHLTPLLSLSTFTALWLTILEFMDKYMHADSSDLLCEAIPESLKNMLLVMHTAGILSSGGEDESQLWRLTWDRIDSFLPLLKEEVFKPHEQAGARNEPARSTISRDAEPPPPDVIPPNTEEQSPPPPTYNHTQVSNSTTPPDVVSQSADSTLPPGDGTNTQQGTAPPPQPPQGASPSPLPQGVPPPQIPQGASPQPYPQGVPPPQIPQGVAPPPFILHPPLPQVSSSGSTGGSVPLLLNPSLMQGTTIPIITPQLATDYQKAQGHH